MRSPGLRTLHRWVSILTLVIRFLMSLESRAGDEGHEGHEYENDCDENADGSGSQCSCLVRYGFAFAPSIGLGESNANDVFLFLGIHDHGFGSITDQRSRTVSWSELCGGDEFEPSFGSDDFLRG